MKVNVSCFNLCMFIHYYLFIFFDQIFQTLCINTLADFCVFRICFGWDAQALCINTLIDFCVFQICFGWDPQALCMNTLIQLDCAMCLHLYWVGPYFQILKIDGVWIRKFNSQPLLILVKSVQS